MKHFEGFLDKTGAPIFSSSFVPSKSATVLGQENGIVHLRIPGTLTQTQNQSRTTYRAALEVYAGGKPIKFNIWNKSRALVHRRPCRYVTLPRTGAREGAVERPLATRLPNAPSSPK